MNPLQVKQSSNNEIFIRWDDGHEGPVLLRSLRDSCPCAGCKGETILFRTYKPRDVQIDVPGRYELKSATPVGSYALKFTWGDGHDLGIYTWGQLRGLCECEACIKQRGV